MDWFYIFTSSSTLIIASLVFTYLFINIRQYLKAILPCYVAEKELVSIGMRCVSGLQGICCTIAGLIIINSCDDIVYERHWLTETYVLIGTGYLVYDLWATYVCYVLQNPSVQQLSVIKSIYMYVKKDPAMIFHHVGLPVVYLPAVMYYRRGVGDGLIGCFMLIEATVPFISFREILVLMKKQKTWLYFINGIFTLVTYTLSRIVIFPWMFWLYGRQIGRSWYEIPFLLHRVCNIGTSAFAALYIYWWFYIFGIAKQELREWFIEGEADNKNGRLDAGEANGTASHETEQGRDNTAYVTSDISKKLH